MAERPNHGGRPQGRAEPRGISVTSAYLHASKHKVARGKIYSAHHHVKSELFPHLLTSASIYYNMAGAVRQPIDIPALERYIEKNVPVIKLPIDVKQVFNDPPRRVAGVDVDVSCSLALGNPTPRISSPPVMGPNM